MDISKLTKAPPGMLRELAMENLDEIVQAGRDALQSRLKSVQRVVMAREAQIKEAKERLFFFPSDQCAKDSIIQLEAALVEWKTKLTIWQNQLAVLDAKLALDKAKKK